MLTKSRHVSADYSLFAENYISNPMACQDKSQKVNGTGINWQYVTRKTVSKLLTNFEQSGMMLLSKKNRR